ncbi:membrane protein [Stenotrophomonas maltophilia]|uniref:membrane protein n=1 Tax=Stenotrophomonas maltophilia TaxID=40324 RepID=UPI00066B2639|nr:membrane protein [Stenotrophomonas maltophilia]
MNTLQHAWQRARRRRALITLLLGLPWALAATVLALRLAGFDIACVVGTVSLLACAAFATARARQLDRQWLQRQLDGSGASEDSADLLFADAATLNPLQQRQRVHVLAMLERAMPELRPRWPRGALALCWIAGLAIVVLAFGWPRSGPGSVPVRTPVPGSAAAAGPLRLQSTRLRIDAPAYTGQATLTQNALDAKVAADSRLSWSLRFDRAPDRAWLQFHDGRRLPLSEREGQWQAQDVARMPLLYRVVSEPALAETRLHRLDVVADRAPSVRVLEPTASLVLGTPGQRQWALRFEASDDYGVAAQATLSITTTQGSGENITFVKRSVTLAGSGEATARRFAHTLDLAALGAQPGNDVIAQLEVRDNHAPTPQTGRSSSVILRLPSAEVALGAELEGRIKKTLPAYFRSQRQIIIDAEALIRQRRSLAAEDFVKRSDAIGVDQRILRLRYGQFLGEESEGAPKPPPTSDLPTSDAPTADGHNDDHEHDHGAQAGAQDDHGHDHGSTANADIPPVFGSETDVLSEYGHTHDHAEATTLLDPQTRATLKAALDQMWSAEGELRQGRPEQALPFAYKALGFIKQVQQAERIYLARVGPELPPIDESRRLGGDRAGLASRELPLAARTPPDPAIVEAWQRLGDDNGAPDLDALAAWQQRNAAYLPDALDLAAAIEQLRIEPDCGDCRQRLRAQLWRALQRPLPQAMRRSAADAMGQRYLDALEAQP